MFQGASDPHFAKTPVLFGINRMAAVVSGLLSTHSPSLFRYRLPRTVVVPASSPMVSATDTGFTVPVRLAPLASEPGSRLVGHPVGDDGDGRALRQFHPEP